MEDKALKQLVEDELEFEPSIDAADIGVSVDHGIVHLTGRVPNYLQKSAAEAAVKRVKGVRGYVEDLQISTFQSLYSDESIAERAANVIDWDVSIPDRAVQVKVEGGRVTLTGKVSWEYQRAAAESAVRRLPGVTGVINDIGLKPTVSATDVKRRIEDALRRQADLDAQAVTVVVEGSKVRLNGKVKAWFERDVIKRAAWAAPGVLAVEDRVSIGG